MPRAEQLSLDSPDASSWLFLPSLPPSAARLNEPTAEIKADASAKDKTTLR